MVLNEAVSRTEYVERKQEANCSVQVRPLNRVRNHLNVVRLMSVSLNVQHSNTVSLNVFRPDSVRLKGRFESQLTADFLVTIVHSGASRRKTCI